MKKVFAWICAITGLALLASASSWPVMSKVLQWNRAHIFNTKWYGKHYSEWGDLVNMCLLDGVSKYREPKAYVFVKPTDNGNKNIDLYLFGDSHTEDVPGYAFANINTYHYGRTIAYTLDPAKKSILLLEVSERSLLSLYHNTEIFDALRKKDDHPIKAVRGGDGKKNYSLVVNKNLDYLLFDYNFINAIRRCKSEMNYSVFGRASGDVAISDNGNYLFFKPTIVPFGMFSSYAAVSENTVNEVVANLNTIYDHYKKEGFAEVYISIIPNPVTLLQPKGYNNLIPRIRDNPSLKIPYLDIYNIFKSNSNPSTLYRVGDTHWNNNGMQIWLNVVNAELRKKSEEYSRMN